jgi:hypothetical protein
VLSKKIKGKRREEKKWQEPKTLPGRDERRLSQIQLRLRPGVPELGLGWVRKHVKAPQSN